MFKAHLIIAWRNLLKNKLYSIINIAGLATGLTVFILIALWIHDELSFNTYHRNYERIGELWTGKTDVQTSAVFGSTAVPYPIATTLREKYPQYFKRVLRAWWTNRYTLTLEDKKFIEYGQLIEGDAIDMLSLKMLRGGSQSLKDPHSIVLSRSTAEAFFGENAMGQTFTINGMDKIENVTVTGIFEDLPSNNDFAQAHFFVPWSLMELSNPWWIKNSQNDWSRKNFKTYVELNQDVSFEKVNDAIEDIFRKNAPPDLFKIIESAKPFAQVIPMSKWHLFSEFENGKPTSGRIVFVWLFGIVGCCVLLLACVNFINLSTARSDSRAREVGVRKAVGSKRSQLVFQFLSESFMAVVLAFVLSLALLVLSMDSFNLVADKKIQLPFNDIFFWVCALVFVLATTLTAGLYPAVYLSSFQPAKVLKGKSQAGRLSAIPRKLLVILQFTVAVALVICTVIVDRQIQFAQNRPVGYNREGLISMEMVDPNFEDNIELVRNELLATGAVSYVAYSSQPLTEVWRTSSGYDWEGKDPSLDVNFVSSLVTFDFGKAIGWRIIDGRDFSPEFSSDTLGSVILNQAAIKYMSIADPVGKQFTRSDEFGKFLWSKTIIGIVEDIVVESPYEPVKPTIYSFHKDAFSMIHIKIAPGMAAAPAISSIQKVFARLVPTAAFDYKFVDVEFGRKFRQEQQVGNLSSIFSILAILISGLGLFGLSSFMVEQRTKEIGIRKVMGAPAYSLWKMLSRSFVLLVLISCCIAAPIAYYLTTDWLQKYSYRTPWPYWDIVLISVGALVITLVTISVHTMKAVFANPVEALRNE